MIAYMIGSFVFGVGVMFFFWAGGIATDEGDIGSASIAVMIGFGMLLALALVVYNAGLEMGAKEVQVGGDPSISCTCRERGPLVESPGDPTDYEALEQSGSGNNNEH